MECPRCKNIFPKFKEILIMVDRSFYCPNCWTRLISYPDERANGELKKTAAARNARS